jgi:hypothetical protein
MRIPFIKDSKQQHQQQQRTNPGAAPTTPIHIVEILETIFSFLDEVTIHQTVILVCLQWLLITRHRVAREVIWDGSGQAKELKQKLHRLPGAGRLTWHWDLYTSDEKGCREPLIAALRVPIRRLEVYDYKVQNPRFSQLPYPPSLTSIKIQMAQTLRWIWMWCLGLVLYW